MLSFGYRAGLGLALRTGLRCLGAVAPTAGQVNQELDKCKTSLNYTESLFKNVAASFLSTVKGLDAEVDIKAARQKMADYISNKLWTKMNVGSEVEAPDDRAKVYQSARCLQQMVAERPDHLLEMEKGINFSMAKTLVKLANNVPVPELQPAFFAEMTHLVLSLEEKATVQLPEDHFDFKTLKGKAAGIRRSQELDKLMERVVLKERAFKTGLDPDVIEYRKGRKEKLCKVFNVTEEVFDDWEWQLDNVITTADMLAKCVSVTPEQLAVVQGIEDAKVPFGLTPYTAMLTDEDINGGHDRSIRMQVLPPKEYLDGVLNYRDLSEDPAKAEELERLFDFMKEGDTSPCPLITRRYPAICIFKPFNTCPQICVYCQRNWEIKMAMDPDALASRFQRKKAIEFIRDHPMIREVLITGGDPLAMEDELFFATVQAVADIDHVDLIRIGSRVPVTMPTRITDEFADKLASFREPGKREVCLSTHVQHPYEITPDMVEAIGKLKGRGITVFNQLVYIFSSSRRFEASVLRSMLRKIGIDPYYTFVPKGKEETNAYRVPIARLMMEQREEARLYPGCRRTDEVVYNVPGLGKNHLRGTHDRYWLSVLPTGERIYEFHAWEKGVIQRDTYIGVDVSILAYLNALKGIGEDVSKYNSIWYYT